MDAMMKNIIPTYKENIAVRSSFARLRRCLSWRCIFCFASFFLNSLSISRSERILSTIRAYLFCKPKSSKPEADTKMVGVTTCAMNEIAALSIKERKEEDIQKGYFFIFSFAAYNKSSASRSIIKGCLLVSSPSITVLGDFNSPIPRFANIVGSKK